MEDIPASIVELVSHGKIQGSRLAPEIRALHPGWTPEGAGALNLRDYIDRYVEGVEVVDRAGMDVVYGRPGDVLLDSNRPEGAVDANPVEASGESVNLWRVWVSPNCPFALAISQDGENVRRVPRDGSDDKQAVLLAPASSECHKIIARDFLKGVDEEDHDALAAILDGETGAWWQPWFRRIQSVGMSDRWHQHRTAALETLLDQSLEVAGITEAAAETAHATIVSARYTGRKAALRPTRPTRQGPIAGSTLLDVVTRAVSEMSTAELRDLKIPIGLVWDAIQHDSN
ncbi:hypothetical protein [Candidatus Neomicrothrix sp.]|uniref:hypothetical protein n=1 Tax=Candidatus Neomicrothrix sp. TaxID=2719034 RepID=UPI001B6F6063|nr:hypothetical protein [Candidatus Microthrix sp.]MBP6135114.1 hypothetical protein [Candidatus Microthrix sp.]MBP6149627.1 hypothetical protein [Candidatus Microthrix sp.]MBP7405257.1 hypothetical protein [Candidatus Microthrix sp.]MBP7852117.1 hypothetical protein [Candidatus Microthrix sp.]MBP7879099.1 hypothetical protein [Candidatus Microthrix sp.]